MPPPTLLTSPPQKRKSNNRAPTPAPSSSSPDPPSPSLFKNAYILLYRAVESADSAAIPPPPTDAAAVTADNFAFDASRRECAAAAAAARAVADADFKLFSKIKEVVKSRTPDDVINVAPPSPLNAPADPLIGARFVLLHFGAVAAALGRGDDGGGGCISRGDNKHTLFVPTWRPLPCAYGVNSQAAARSREGGRGFHSLKELFA